MDFKEYPSYKDSGVEWLGKVPELWDVKRLKYLFSIKNGATPKSNVSQFWDGDIKWVTPSDLSKLESHEIAESSRTITVEGFNSCGTNLVPAGSIIVSCRAPIGSLAITLTSLCTNQGCKSLVASKILNIKFYFYFLSISADKLNSLGNGTTFLELSSFELKNLSILAPRLEEQTQIVSFLDSETSRIDNLIAKQEKLIEKLEEHRKSVISHAVTKGLDPNVPMKDSGVEWLGEVPKHWEIKHLKHTLEVQLRNGLFKSKEFFGSGNKLINVSDVYTEGNIIDESKLELVMTTQKELDTYKVSHGDIFFVRSSLKFSGIAQSSCYLGNSDDVVFECHIVGARPNTKIVTPEFLIRYLNSVKVINEFIRRSKTTTMTTIDQNQIATVHIALPSIEEQKAINTYLDNKCFKINQLICKQRELIAKLKEYRTSIISYAVTGKIDVRDLVA